MLRRRLRVVRGPATGRCKCVERVGQCATAHRPAELLRGLVFQVVRFVDDEVVEGRYRTAARGDIGEQQRVVDDDDVCGFGGFTRALKEALAFADVAVLAGEAIGVLRGKALPGGPLAFVEVEFRAVAGLSFRQPEEHGGRQVGEIGVAEPGPVCRNPAAKAEVVRAALQD